MVSKFTLFRSITLIVLVVMSLLVREGFAQDDFAGKLETPIDQLEHKSILVDQSMQQNDEAETFEDAELDIRSEEIRKPEPVSSSTQFLPSSSFSPSASSPLRESDRFPSFKAPPMDLGTRSTSQTQTGQLKVQPLEQNKIQFSRTSSESTDIVVGYKTSPSSMFGESSPGGPSSALIESVSNIKTQIESPKSINVNKQGLINVRLTNTGQHDVDGVIFEALIPPHTNVTSTTPRPFDTQGRILKFRLDQIQGGGEKTIRLDVIPTSKDPIDIKTTLHLENRNQFRIGVLQPKLLLAIDGPSQANLGDSVEYKVMITNTGDGEATNVQLKTLFPESLRLLQSNGNQTIKSIKPGQTIDVVYQTQAVYAGSTDLQITAASDDGSDPESKLYQINVFEPKLEVAAIGPNANFIDRNGIYTLRLDNAGPVDLNDVHIGVQIPDGIRVTTINREAQIDSEQGILHWTFNKLTSGANEQIQIMTTATKEGNQVFDILVNSRETAEKRIQMSTAVSTRAEVNVDLRNDSGPVQVGGQATFVMDVTNLGSRDATGVKVQIDVANALKVIPLENQGVTFERNSIVFNESRIAPGQKVTFRFSAIGQVSGEHLVRSITQVDGSERTTISEDSVHVYDVHQAQVRESLTPEIKRR